MYALLLSTSDLQELKEAVAQRKHAMSEYTEVTDKLSELRQQKQKMSRQVRDKEEELETSLQKIDTLRQVAVKYALWFFPSFLSWHDMHFQVGLNLEIEICRHNFTCFPIELSHLVRVHVQCSL